MGVSTKPIRCAECYQAIVGETVYRLPPLPWFFCSPKCLREYMGKDASGADNRPGFVSACCTGKLCDIGDCNEPAAAKVEETIFHDDPLQQRHPLTAYVCAKHFRMIMGGAGVDLTEEMREAKASEPPPLPRRTRYYRLEFGKENTPGCGLCAREGWEHTGDCKR